MIISGNASGGGGDGDSSLVVAVSGALVESDADQFTEAFTVQVPAAGGNSRLEVTVDLLATDNANQKDLYIYLAAVPFVNSFSLANKAYARVELSIQQPNDQTPAAESWAFIRMTDDAGAVTLTQVQFQVWESNAPATLLVGFQCANVADVISMVGVKVLLFEAA